MSNFPKFDLLTFAVQADLLTEEKEVENFLGSGEDYSTQLTKAKDDLLGFILKAGVDPDQLIQGKSTAQLKDLHIFLTLVRIYRDEINIEDDHFDLKHKQYAALVKQEDESVIRIRGLDQDTDEDGSIDVDSEEEQRRNLAKMQPRVRRL